jgi:hypothetical protein
VWLINGRKSLHCQALLGSVVSSLKSIVNQVKTKCLINTIGHQKPRVSELSSMGFYNCLFLSLPLPPLPHPPILAYDQKHPRNCKMHRVTQLPLYSCEPARAKFSATSLLLLPWIHRRIQTQVNITKPNRFHLESGLFQLLEALKECLAWYCLVLASRLISVSDLKSLLLPVEPQPHCS